MSFSGKNVPITDSNLSQIRNLMTVILGWVLFGLVILFLLSFAVGVVRYYSDSAESSKLSKLVVVLALFVQLLIVLLLPIDVLIVASNTNSADGSQVDPAQTSGNGQAIKFLYYIFYSTIAGLGFLFLPFAFFFYEEDDEDSSLREKVCAATKYTFGFVMILVVLVVVGLFLHHDASGSSDDSWINVLKDSYAAADRMAAFFIGCLSAFGCLFLVVYTSYGMAFVPMSMIRKVASHDGGSYDAYTPINNNARKAAAASNARNRRSTTSDYSELASGVDSQIVSAQRKNQERIRFLTSRYAMSSDTEWTQADRLQLHDLKREENRLAGLIDAQRQSASSARAAASDDSCGAKIYSCASGCVTAVVEAVGCVRTLIGVVLLLLSLVLIGSLGATAADRYLNSTCKTACGYAVTTPSYFNPINALLVASSSVFPIDYLVFGGIALYMFVCTVAAMCALGIRLLCVTYQVRKGNTQQNAIILMAFVLIFVTLALNVQFQTLAPQYSSFGTQFYLAEHHTNNTANGIEFVKSDCTLDQITNSTNPKQCVLTQMSRFTHQLTTSMPFFGLIFFFASLAFIALFLLFLLRFACCKMSEVEVIADDDESSL